MSPQVKGTSSHPSRPWWWLSPQPKLVESPVTSSFSLQSLPNFPAQIHYSPPWTIPTLRSVYCLGHPVSLCPHLHVHHSLSYSLKVSWVPTCRLCWMLRTQWHGRPGPFLQSHPSIKEDSWAVGSREGWGSQREGQINPACRAGVRQTLKGGTIWAWPLSWLWLCREDKGSSSWGKRRKQRPMARRCDPNPRESEEASLACVNRPRERRERKLRK